MVENTKLNFQEWKWNGAGNRKMGRFQGGYNIANVQNVESRELAYNIKTIVNEFYCASFMLSKKFIPVSA